jgi:hypothetical protein
LASPSRVREKKPDSLVDRADRDLLAARGGSPEL